MRAASTYQTLIEHWDGSAWSVVSGRDADTYTWLAGVTCTSASNCWAVGRSSSGSLTLRWDGTSWKKTAAPGWLELRKVACITASDCWAIGAVTGGSESSPQALHWDGANWAIVTMPAVTPEQGTAASLVSLACPSAANCWAAGAYLGVADAAQNQHYKTLIEHWDGQTWTRVDSPNAQPAGDNLLRGVACASDSDCWATGTAGDLQADEIATLIEHWDGVRWSIVPSPNVPEPANELGAVTCVSPSLCWAVGQHENITTDQTLIERWDGTAWTIFPSPNQPGPEAQLADNFLLAVRCLSAAECWSVGTYSQGSSSEGTLTLRFIATYSPPIANAGADFSIDEGQAGQLNGSGTDPDVGDMVSYAWSQVLASGDPQVTLSEPTSPGPAFTAPAVSRDTTLTFHLTVSDAHGASASDDVIVTVRNVNLPPVASAGADITVDEGEAGQLSGAGSDPDAGDILRYAWSQVAAAGEPQLTLTDVSSPTTRFAAPAVSRDTPVTLVLTATDASGASASDEVIVTVRNIDPAPAPPARKADVGNNWVGALSLQQLLALALLGLGGRALLSFSQRIGMFI